jgi:hypothetical protein
MLLVGVVVMLIWGGMMGLQWYVHFRLARIYSIQEHDRREMAQRDLGQGDTRTIAATWGLKIADFYAALMQKHPGAMRRPWIAVDPDPPAWEVTTGQPCDPPWARRSPSTPAPAPPSEIPQQPPDIR